ncbi:DoxX family protein [Nocardia sp. AG03]|uniref:DoxX family protein n=1 Tax=Nocardia sp. AG03 TaxID=3025312 RepID=UPI00241878CD|nr:DoxX family protein [Nocardia sp. AG03]
MDTRTPVAHTNPGLWGTVAFRFCFVYFGLYCLLTTYIPFALLGIAGRWIREFPGPWNIPFTDPLTGWVGRVFFGVDATLRMDSGAGDQTAIWVLVLCLLVVAALVATGWTAVAARTPTPRLSAWFTLFLRVCLGGQMIGFGFAKLIPTQMPAPSLAQLVQPYGDLSPASVLWLQVGSSPAYQMTLGAVEVTAGLLLFVSRTAVLGAALTLASTAQILLLNLTFDIPEKLLSFHLLLISLILLAPYLRALTDLFVRQRACAPLRPPALFPDERRDRRAAWLVAALGLWVALGSGYDRWVVWQEQYGAASPRSELYGIWEVRDLTVAGNPIPPLTTDETRWRRVVFDRPGAATYQHMSGELVTVRAEFRPGGQLVLTTEDDRPFATLTADRHADDLSLRGTLHDRPVEISLRRIDPDSFTLRGRGFHWVQDYPYFR